MYIFHIIEKTSKTTTYIFLIFEKNVKIFKRGEGGAKTSILRNYQLMTTFPTIPLNVVGSKIHVPCDAEHIFIDVKIPGAPYNPSN